MNLKMQSGLKDNKTIGFATLTPYENDIANLSLIILKEKFRGAKRGGFLVKAVRDEATLKLGYKSVELFATSLGISTDSPRFQLHARAARRLYERYGFESIGTERTGDGKLLGTNMRYTKPESKEERKSPTTVAKKRKPGAGVLLVPLTNPSPQAAEHN